MTFYPDNVPLQQVLQWGIIKKQKIGIQVAGNQYINTMNKKQKKQVCASKDWQSTFLDL